MEAWRGTYQDQSKNALAMKGSVPTSWAQVNGLPCLVTPNVASAATPAVIDVTGSFTVETMCAARYGGAVVFQQSGLGGWYRYNHAIGWHSLYLLNAAGALAITFSTPAGTLITNRIQHVVFSSIGGGASGAAWVNGIPVTVSRATPAAPAANVAVAVAAVPTSSTAYLLARAYPFTLTNADVATLYNAASRLMK